MNKLILWILCLMFQGYALANNDRCIVLLTGNGSCGKTSITTALSKMSDDWRRIVDEDQILYRVEREAIKEQFPEEYKTVIKAIKPCNVLTAVQNNILAFRKSADEESQEAAKIALKTITSFKKQYRFFTLEDIFQEIEKALDQNKML